MLWPMSRPGSPTRPGTSRWSRRGCSTLAMAPARPPRRSPVVPLLSFQVSGQGGVPVSGAGAVVLNVTAVTPAAAGFVTVYPTGASRPLASNLNFVGGQVVANFVIAKLGTGGKVSLYNSPGSGPVHLVADVAGWFPDGVDSPTCWISSPARSSRAPVT